MNQSLQKLKNFLTIDMWRLKSDDVSKPKYLLVSILKKLYLAITFFFIKGTSDYAAALTYSTSLSALSILT